MSTLVTGELFSTYISNFLHLSLQCFESAVTLATQCNLSATVVGVCPCVTFVTNCY